MASDDSFCRQRQQGNHERLVVRWNNVYYSSLFLLYITEQYMVLIITESIWYQKDSSGWLKTKRDCFDQQQDIYAINLLHLSPDIVVAKADESAEADDWWSWWMMGGWNVRKQQWGEVKAWSRVEKDSSKMIGWQWRVAVPFDWRKQKTKDCLRLWRQENIH